MDVGYVHLMPEPRPEIKRQVCVDDSIIFDVDWTGRPVGVELLGNNDWAAALARLCLAGEVRLVHSVGQPPSGSRSGG